MLKNKKVIVIIIGIILILSVAGLVVFLNGKGDSNLDESDIAGKGDLTETADYLKEEDEGKNSDKLDRSDEKKENSADKNTVEKEHAQESFAIPEVEIKQSSDGKGNQKPVTVNTDGKVDVNKIEGYQSEEEKKDDVSEKRIRIDSIGSYSGPYVEDGNDEEVEGILSIVVTNISEEFLQYSQITMTNGENTATFSVSNLPEGASALVLEVNQIEAKGNWTYEDDTSAFIDKAVMHSDLFSWEGGDYTLILTNKSEKTYGKVYVYYKNVQDGIYIGGITYRVLFENVQAGETLQKQSKHFSGNNSHVMMIDYIDE